MRLDANQTPETTTKEEGHVGLWDLNKIQGFNFVNWVKNSFTKKAFMVMKMDIEGTKFDDVS